MIPSSGPNRFAAQAWVVSFSFHMLFFLTLFYIGRNRLVELTPIQLDFSKESRSFFARDLSSAEEEEWRRPQLRAKGMARTRPAESFSPSESLSGLRAGNGEGEVQSAAQVSQLPHLIRQEKASYPETAKRANIEGVVILQVDIDATGGVKKVDLIQGIGYGCDEAALAAARQWQFSPALAGGEAVPVRIRIPYRFKLVE